MRQKYGSKERDNETGLDFFEVRYFSSVQGRFTSIDPLLASGRPGNPQSWNRYSYALNKPMSLVDPSGMLPVGNTENSAELEDETPQQQKQQIPTSIKTEVTPLKKFNGEVIKAPTGEPLSVSYEQDAQGNVVEIPVYGEGMIVSYTILDQDSNPIDAKKAGIELKEEVSLKSADPEGAAALFKEKTSQTLEPVPAYKDGKFYDFQGIEGKTPAL